MEFLGSVVLKPLFLLTLTQLSFSSLTSRHATFRVSWEKFDFAQSNFLSFFLSFFFSFKEVLRIALLSPRSILTKLSVSMWEIPKTTGIGWPEVFHTFTNIYTQCKLASCLLVIKLLPLSSPGHGDTSSLYKGIVRPIHIPFMQTRGRYKASL